MRYSQQFPQFLDSDVGAAPLRLDHRYSMLFSSQASIYEGATVLDISSHDGRWTNAALQCGAKHVTGVESRSTLTDKTRENLSDIGVSKDRYSVITNDFMDWAENHTEQYDVVLCLGFFYHIYEHNILMSYLNRLTRKHLIIDTYVWPSESTMCNIYKDVGTSNAARSVSRYSVGNITYAAEPSLAALHMFLKDYGFTVKPISDHYISKLNQETKTNIEIADYVNVRPNKSYRIALLASKS